MWRRIGCWWAWLVGVMVTIVLSWQVAELLLALSGPDLNVGR